MWGLRGSTPCCAPCGPCHEQITCIDGESMTRCLEVEIYGVVAALGYGYGPICCSEINGIHRLPHYGLKQTGWGLGSVWWGPLPHEACSTCPPLWLSVILTNMGADGYCYIILEVTDYDPAQVPPPPNGYYAYTICAVTQGDDCGDQCPEEPLCAQIRRGLPWVDHYYASYAGPHYLEWNLFNSGHSATMATDLDGILCDEKTGLPLQWPRREPVLAIVTGPPEGNRPATERWLAQHGIRYGQLLMGPWQTLPPSTEIGVWKAQQYQRLGAAFRRERPGASPHDPRPHRPACPLPCSGPRARLSYDPAAAGAFCPRDALAPGPRARLNHDPADFVPV